MKIPPFGTGSTISTAGPMRTSSPALNEATRRLRPFTITPEGVSASTTTAPSRPRPGRITDIVDIDLGRPRGIATREEPRYFQLVTVVREALRRGGADEATAEGELEGAIASIDRTAAEGGIG